MSASNVSDDVDLILKDDQNNKLQAQLKDIFISKSEFAEYLRLKESSLFVSMIFDVASQDKPGFMTFREFLNINIIFTEGI